MKARSFQPGFRISLFDGAVLIAGAAAAAYALTIDRWFAIAISFVVLHFFLFCNVLRMSRSLELIWAAVFVTTAMLSVSFGAFPLWWSFVASLVATLAATAIEIRRPSYHGVGWKWLNPRLPEWWRSSEAGREVK